jgi:hypothetical protein
VSGLGASEHDTDPIVKTGFLLTMLGWPTLFSSPSLVDSESVSWHRFPRRRPTVNTAEDNAIGEGDSGVVRYLLHSIRSEETAVPGRAVRKGMHSAQAVSSSSSLLFIGANSLYALPLVMQILRKVMHLHL